MNDKLKGFLYGIATSVTFGLIPLFTLPLMQKGMTSDSILFYRFLAATLALGAMLVIKRESFRIAWRDVPMLVLLSFFYTASAHVLVVWIRGNGSRHCDYVTFHVSCLRDTPDGSPFPRTGIMGDVDSHRTGCRRCGEALFARWGDAAPTRWA